VIQVPATPGMKLAAILGGVALLGIGQSGALERGWVAKLAGAGMLGTGLYWLFTSVTPQDTP